jgi:hypothetical protein
MSKFNYRGMAPNGIYVYGPCIKGRDGDVFIDSDLTCQERPIRVIKESICKSSNIIIKGRTAYERDVYEYVVDDLLFKVRRMGMVVYREGDFYINDMLLKDAVKFLDLNYVKTMDRKPV